LYRAWQRGRSILQNSPEISRRASTQTIGICKYINYYNDIVYAPHGKPDALSSQSLLLELELELLELELQSELELLELLSHELLLSIPQELLQSLAEDERPP
jgi:hypothetical protein